jgi:hypothetical protein
MVMTLIVLCNKRFIDTVDVTYVMWRHRRRFVMLQ